MDKKTRRGAIVAGIVAIILAVGIPLGWHSGHPPIADPSPGISTAKQLAPPPAPPVVDPVVYVTNTGKKYHRAGCRYLKSVNEIRLSVARGAYEPCSVCRPPK